MAQLAKLLQEKIQALEPWGMKAYNEYKLLSSDLERTLGFSPRVDVVLQSENSAVRYWIEFEISRADPVANHAKYATSYIFQPITSDDVFISMVSNHVARGRKNLGACTIALMRRLGLRAFQTTLFPKWPGERIKEINHLPWEEISRLDIEVQAELDRIQAITEPLGRHGKQEIHFAANTFDVYLNVHNWNRDIWHPTCRELWGRRTITYFVYNLWTQEFAPSKFCAYTAVSQVNSEWPTHDKSVSDASMTIEAYAAIDQQNNLFDGYRARKHLVNELGFHLEPANDKLMHYFHNWMQKHEQFIKQSKNGPYFILEKYGTKY
ncbi:MAG: hypothetical protein R6V55_03910 [Desulfovermiculus sp.]